MYPDIQDFIPHRRPMLLLNAMTHVSEQSMQATLTLTADCPFVRADGTLEPVALLEAMAQCFAGGCGLLKPSQWGYLAAVRRFEVCGTARVGDVLRASVQVLTQVDAIVVVEGRIDTIHTATDAVQTKINAAASTDAAHLDATAGAKVHADTPLLGTAQFKIFAPEHAQKAASAGQNDEA